MARHCSECGFVNADGAHYCSRCGAFIGQPSESKPPQSTTATYVIDERTGELRPVEVEDVASGGGALVVRSGGRVGESFPLRGDRVTIGRTPDADVFLDDVTVSRDHAVLVARGDSWHLDDSGSLNGTYVNRRRIDSARLDDGDEVQVGKFKLTYLAG